jgi:hypothetical protein
MTGFDCGFHPNAIVPAPALSRVRSIRQPSRKRGGRSAAWRIRISSLPLLSERRALRSAPARRLFAGGRASGDESSILPGGFRLPGHRGHPPCERMKAPMRTESLRRGSIPVQPTGAAGLSCPRTVPSNVPVPCLRSKTASAEPSPAPMTPDQRAPRRERVIGI